MGHVRMESYYTWDGPATGPSMLEHLLSPVLQICHPELAEAAEGGEKLRPFTTAILVQQADRSAHF